AAGEEAVGIQISIRLSQAARDGVARGRGAPPEQEWVPDGDAVRRRVAAARLGQNSTCSRLHLSFRSGENCPGWKDRRWKNHAYASTPTTRAPTRSSPTNDCSNSRKNTASNWSGFPTRCASPNSWERWKSAHRISG